MVRSLRWSGVRVLPFLLCAAASCFAAAPMWAATTGRISVAGDGTQANGSNCEYVSVNADGRYVAFSSDASNLVPGDTSDGWYDVFVHDRVTGRTERVSVASDGMQGTEFSAYPSLSADGRYVAFYSYAPNLVLGDTNSTLDVFTHDRQTGQTARESVASDGTQADQDSEAPSISADGRYLAFGSCASNLVARDKGPFQDIFVHDRVTGMTELVSVASDGTHANERCCDPQISADGRYVAFQSEASNLVAGDTNGVWDIFIHDRLTGQTERVSVSSDGTQGDDVSQESSLSGDGRYVAFYSFASNLTSGDVPGTYDVFVHDRQTGGTVRVALATCDQLEVQGLYPKLAVSADGRYVAFQSTASDLVAGDTNGHWDVFVYDLDTGECERASISSEGAEANGDSLHPAISADGSVVVFESEAWNLVAGDTNAWPDIFVRDRRNFPDVGVGFWAFEETTDCFRAGIVQGYPDGTYKPTDPVTRDQMAVYISRALAGGDAAVPAGPSAATFSDVATDNWAFKYVEYAVDRGVVKGYDDGTYKPTDQVDRGQMAVFVARAIATPTDGADLVNYTPPTTATFADVPTGFWAYKYVEYIAQPSVGVTQGYPDEGYHPEYVCTRDQMAVYVARAFKLPV